MAKGRLRHRGAQRAIDLKRPTTKSMYDQFAHFDPKPAFSDGPGEPPSFEFDSLPKEGPAPAIDTTLNLKLNGKDKQKGKDTEKKPPAAPGKK